MKRNRATDAQQHRTTTTADDTLSPFPSPIYYGAISCQQHTRNGDPCTNMAYYRVDGKDDATYRCGVHSKQNKRRKMLPHEPNQHHNRQRICDERQALVEAQAKANFPNRGRVIVTQMRMLKSPEHHDGFLKVFPNFRHGARNDGFGCPALSPKSLGPIDHGMPDIPIAQNLENYHQAAKVFLNDVDADQCLTPEAIKLRKALYQDKQPHRHKYPTAVLKDLYKQAGIDTNINVPLFSVYYDTKGNERRYSYLECRYFYCHWYEKLAPRQPDFQKLQTYLRMGYNLQIVGYDGYGVTKDLYEHYLDTSRPFGHELVLYALLTIDDPNMYPWNRYYRQHTEIYENVI